MKNANQKQQFAALVSQAGNWDVVVDIHLDDYDQKKQGRMEIGWYDSEAEAESAIENYRKDEAGA